eukprot:jgi/Tetstr1/424939/TSEL_015432.t1
MSRVVQREFRPQSAASLTQVEATESAGVPPPRRRRGNSRALGAMGLTPRRPHSGGGGLARWVARNLPSLLGLVMLT